MPKIGRNQPCPCGSGKKYKRCCLRGDAQQRNQERLEIEAPGRAMTWLHQHHGEEMQRAFREQFLGSLDDDAIAVLSEQSEAVWQMLEVNGWELVLAEGVLGVEDDLAGSLDLVLGAGGPLLDASQRTYLEKLNRAPLSLYEVVESNPGVGFSLRDLLDDEEPVRWVAERAGSQSLGSGSVLGARLIPGSPWKLSGAIYGFEAAEVPSLLEDLRFQLDGKPGEDPALEREIRSSVLVDTWLSLFIQPPPSIVDLSSGEPSLLINDDYRVVDWDAFEAALAEQHDVVGERSRSWARLWEPDAEVSSTRLAINPRGEDRIEAFARSRTMADEGRVWLEEIAGDAISWITREVVDPLSLMDRKRKSPSPPSSEPPAPSQLPEGIHQQLYEHIYRDWADQPIPALGNRPPRQAVETPEGKRQVIELLESYERGEKKEATVQGREVADLGFMWRELGLERVEGV